MITINPHQLQGQHSTLGQLVILSVMLMAVSGQFTNPGCSNFDVNNECIACADRYYLQNGICYPVSPLCLTYNNTNGACLTCYQGYSINGTTCSRASTPNCAQYNANGVCTQCQNRFYLSGQNCLAVGSACTTYLNDGNCTGCVSNYLLFSGKCYPAISNCLTQSLNTCSECKNSYILAGNVCHPQILHCLTYNSQGACSTCQPKLILVGNGAACLPQIDNCTVYNLTSGECLVCEPYFRVIQGQCAIMLDPFCKTFNSTVCIECSTRYFFNTDRRCQAVSDLCQSYNPQGQCLTCYNGYELSGTICVKAVAKMDPFCSIFNGPKCQKCSWGYRFDATGKCVELDYLCWRYNTTTYECIECYPGFMVRNSTKCEVISQPGCLTWANNACKSCFKGYYLHNQHCQQIDPLCSSFDLNTLTCLNCYQGYRLVNSICEIIPPNSPTASCKTTSPQGQCLSCYYGSYLSNGKCLEVDTLCRTFNMITGECTSCYGGYFLLNRSGKCYPLA